MSLNFRISLLTTAVVLATSGALIYRTHGLMLDADRGQVAREADRAAVRFGAGLEELVRDAQFLAGTPAVQGILRGKKNGGVDPLDGSPSELWEVRLQTLFSKLLESKPQYGQIRFIGLADGGRELVRVDRGGPDGTLRAVPSAALQRKGSTSYVQSALTLGQGQTHVSRIELNREAGVISWPHQPVIRAVTPIRGPEDDAVFGVVVINADVGRSLATFRNSLPDASHQIYLVDSDGYFLHHPDASRTFGFEFGRAPDALAELPELAGQLSGTNDAPLERLSRRVLGAAKVGGGLTDQTAALTFVVTDQIPDSEALFYEIVQQLAVVILGLVVLAIAIGSWLARGISRPILDLAAAVNRVSLDGQPLVLPRGLVGEAAVLGAAFEDSYTKLGRQQEALRASNRELNQFAYVASHDLQEPLRTIRSFVGLLDEDYGSQLDAQAHRYLGFVVASCERMSTLVHGLLEYSRLGKTDDFGEVDLEDVLRDVRAELDPRVLAVGGTVRWDEMPPVYGNRELLRRLFQNLLSNGLKFGRPGVPPILHVGVKPSGTRWEFRVSDNGIGIAEEHRERIFLIFQRLHSREEIDGAGVGLAQCKKIAELHETTLSVGVAQGAGAVFVFSLEGIHA